MAETIEISLQHPRNQTTLLSQKRKDNQLAPISRLPIEVLGEIFGHLQTQIYDHWNDPDEPGYHPFLRWIPVATHVCHAWREVAIHTAVLWQDVSVVASPSWAVEFALRSKNARLHITASNSGVDTIEKMRPVIRDCTEHLVQASVQRVETIVLDCFPCCSVHRILSCRSSPTNECVTFPVLSRLEVATLEPLVLTNDSLCAPSLKSLEVRDFCSVDWKAFSLLQNISYLDISTFSDASVADLGAIHKALCQMPNLIELALYPEDNVVGPKAIVLPAAPYRPATLPNLRRICLKTYFSIWLSSILQCIAYGPRRDLSISVTCDAVADIKELLSKFPSIVQHAEESSIRSLYIQMVTGRIHFTGWRRVERHNAWHDASINIAISMPTTLRPPPSYPFGLSVLLLNKSLSGVHLRRLTSLSLVFNEPVPAETWVRLFGSLPNLLMVDIRLGLCELCAALVNDIRVTPESPHLSSTTNDCIIPFRALQSITVREEKGPYSDGDMDYMLRCLRKRVDRKVPLKKIIFDKDVKDHGLELGVKELVEFVVGTTSSK